MIQTLGKNLKIVCAGFPQCAVRKIHSLLQQTDCALTLFESTDHLLHFVPLVHWRDLLWPFEEQRLMGWQGLTCKFFLISDLGCGFLDEMLAPRLLLHLLLLPKATDMDQEVTQVTLAEEASSDCVHGGTDALQKSTGGKNH